MTNCDEFTWSIVDYEDEEEDSTVGGDPELDTPNTPNISGILS